MRWIPAICERVRALATRSRQDAELAEELRFHLEQEAELLRQQGLDPKEAEHQARLRFGGIELHKEDVREARGLRWIEDLARDLTLTARSLARRPGYVVGVVLTLGLGIGATTTIYSIVDAVMLRPLPYSDPSTLVAVGTLEPGAEWLDQESGLHDLAPISFPNYLDLRERARSFDDLAALMILEAPMSVGGGDPQTVRIAGVTPGMFEMLDVAPTLGRAFIPEDYVPIMSEALVLTYGAWQRRYGGDPGIVGQAAVLGGVAPATIVGVLARDFDPPEAFFPGGEIPDFWAPIQVHDRKSESRRYRELYLLGRLARGTSLEQARAETAGIAADFAAEFPEDNQSEGSPLGIGVNGLHAQTLGTAGRGLEIFLGAAALLLLLGALNAATLLLARALDRTQELGVRAALGASRQRVVRLLMSEAALLSAVSGTFGVVLAYGAVAVFIRYAPSSIPRLGAVAVDAPVLAMAAVVSLGTGMAVGLLPALRVTRRSPWNDLHQVGRTFAEPSPCLRGVLVSGQMAVVVVLLSGAALLFGSFVRMRTVDPGFEADGLVVARGDDIKGAPGWNPQAPWETWDVMLEALRAVPGVDAVALASNVPLEASAWETRLLTPGDTPDTGRRGIAGYAITPGYLEMMGTQLIRGRDFGLQDGPGAERVALVNESFVRTQLGGADAVGTVVQWSAATEWSPIRIVGVVEDVVQARVAEGPRPAIYVPYTQAPAFDPTAVVRTALPPETIFAGLRRATSRFNPSTSEWEVELDTMRDRLASEHPTLRFQAMLIGAFALIALVLATAGLYASLAHSVGRRRRELGVRMALGADRAGVLAMVLGQGMRLSMTGIAIGMVTTLFFTRALSGFLYGVQPDDPATLLAVGAALVLVSAVACLAPARRATTIDAATVLSAE